MSIVRFIKELTSDADACRELSEEDAHDLFAAMLDGGVPDMELGACLSVLRMKHESASELHGFYRAASERVYVLKPPATALRLLIFATYCGARQEPNLLPLLVLLLRRMGVPVLVHGTLEGGGLRMVGADHPRQLAQQEAFLLVTGFDALLIKCTEGEPFANPKQRPRIKFFRQGEAVVLFEEEMHSTRGTTSQPSAVDAAATAAWVKQAMAGQVPIPHPLVNQLACCLYASGYTDDMNQAKAIAAVEAGGLTPQIHERSIDGGHSRTVT